MPKKRTTKNPAKLASETKRQDELKQTNNKTPTLEILYRDLKKVAVIRFDFLPAKFSCNNFKHPDLNKKGNF